MNDQPTFNLYFEHCYCVHENILLTYIHYVVTYVHYVAYIHTRTLEMQQYIDISPYHDTLFNIEYYNIKIVRICTVLTDGVVVYYGCQFYSS